MDAVPHRFSSRTQWEPATDQYTEALAAARAAARPLLDLTASNPTACGLHFDSGILTPLRDPAALVYDPDPRGMLCARQAVAAYYADHGAAVDPGDLILTTSTSEAYSHLFRLLCDPGDELLTAQPSYPLFDLLAQLEDVVLRPYPLFYDHGWSIDTAALAASITPRTRAILLVHPNNPTGHYTSASERTALYELCALHGLALIVDEVFLDYPRVESPDSSSFAASDAPVLTFVLSGLSKIAALPQMKASWILSRGPAPARQAALARLEVIADTFLSMNAPIQHALPSWLAARQGIQRQIMNRVRANFTAAQAACDPCDHLGWLEWQSGWNLILRVPAREPDVALAARLVTEAGVIVHPGSFYGMSASGHLVVSLLPEPEVFSEGIHRLATLITTQVEESS